MTWASTDLADCLGHSVVVIELEDGVDAGKLLPWAKNIRSVVNLVAYWPPSGAWPHPLLGGSTPIPS